MTDQYERLSTDSAPTDRDLDRLLERWHTDNVHRAAARRDELLAALRASGARNTPTPVREPQMTFLEHCRIFAMHRYTRAAACLIVLVALITLLVPTRASVASDWLLVPDGGRLDARDANGGLIGPCPLNHTDVTVEVSGPFSRVTVNQRYTNDYDETIEAVYVFPLSHEGAVDRMTMTVGDRVVVGEVKERAEARQIYESARAAGYVASLLEQERPNIFTQSVANIEPGATIDIEISYVELIETVDGVSSFTFPMVVAPRYIPGSTHTTRSLVPAELDDRRGVVLLGPAQIQLTDVPEEQQTTRFSPLPAGRLHTMLKTASPIAYPGTPWWGEGENASMPAVWSTFTANYANGSKEIGWLYDDGTGQVNGRWFFLDADLTTDHGTGYESNTDQVPDASRITPMPVPPGTRAGHDVSVTVHLDTGGPALEWIESELHTVSGNTVKGDSTATVVLAKETEIPNRDFILRWKQNDEAVNDAHFAHFDADKDGFFTLLLQPPGRPTNADARAREIVFVLDCSGSMEGFPIEKAKQTMLAALKTLRPKDVFNVVTFNNSHEALYAAPQPGTEANVARGEQSMSLRDLVDLPADGRAVEVVCPTSSIRRFTVGAEAIVSDDLSIKLAIDGLPAIPSDHVRLEGTWTLQEGHRTLVVSTFTAAPEPDVPPLRLVLFLSDGEVGNDDAVIQAVRDNAADARVFTIAIGDSPNRSLLDAMAEAGRGKADYVTLSGSPDETVARFVRRIQTPVLTDITLALDGIEIHDTIPALDAVPDLYDEQPLVIHGRYTDAAKGTLTVRGNTGGGAFERAIAVDLPEAGDEHDVI
ncbi:MAG: VIT and vWA domain-containing protein, partial [Planctomycetota bacterium]